MNWINSECRIFDSDGLLAASIAGDVELISDAIVRSFKDPDIKQGELDKLKGGKIIFTYVQVVSERRVLSSRPVDFEINWQYSGTYKQFFKALNLQLSQDDFPYSFKSRLFNYGKKDE